MRFLVMNAKAMVANFYYSHHHQPTFVLCGLFLRKKISFEVIDIYLCICGKKIQNKGVFIISFCCFIAIFYQLSVYNAHQRRLDGREREKGEKGEKEGGDRETIEKNPSHSSLERNVAGLILHQRPFTYLV